MIRINLMPGSKRQVSSASSSQNVYWFATYFAAAVITVAVLVWVYLGRSAVLNEQRARNRSLEREIAALEEEAANLDAVRTQLEESRQLETVVNDLQRARYGPTRVLMALARMLSEGGMPEIDPTVLAERRRTNPTLGVNPTWDHRSLWITQFEENAREANIRGVGRSNDDVAEFLQRLTLSEVFDDIQLVQTEGTTDRDTGLPLINFQLSCRVVY